MQKKINIKEFVEQGYLQEVNRQFFHPLGLALEVKKTGDEYQLDGIWDFREIKGGVRFSDNIITSKEFIDRCNNIKKLQKTKNLDRKLLYDEISQKVPREVE